MWYDGISDKQNQLRRYFVKEFKRELDFILDVLAGRAQAKTDFTDKIVKLSTGVFVSIFQNTPIPGLGGVGDIVEVGASYWNERRKQASQTFLAKEALSMDEKVLTIILDNVALEICCRYHFFLEQKLTDDSSTGIQPLVRTMVERMLSHLVARKLPITEKNLLDGLMAGLSGAYVRGYKNTLLSLKMKEGSIYTAEGLLGRSGFMTPDGVLWVLPEKKKAYYHQQPQSFSNKGLMDHGYTKIQNGCAKYGYPYVSRMVVDQWYGHLPESKIQDLREKQDTELTQYKPSLVRINKQLLQNYLLSFRQNPNLSLREYVRQLFTNPQIKMVIYSPDKIEDYDLTVLDFKGADLSYSVFNGCCFGHSLERCNFQQSYLRASDFTKVTSAAYANFLGAQLQYLQAREINFNQANFNQASIAYADFKNANMESIQNMDLDCIGANVEHVQGSTTQNGKFIPQLTGESRIRLQEAYRTRTRLKPLFGKELTLVEQQAVSLKMTCPVLMSSGGATEASLPQVPDNIRYDKVSVHIDQLFLPDNNLLDITSNAEILSSVSPRIVLIQGVAGSGKTTFIHKLLAEWANGGLWPKCPWVFLLRLRELKEGVFLKAFQEEKVYSLKEWVYHALYSSKMSFEDFIVVWRSDIEPQLQQCIFVLDGYDELPIEHPCKPALDELLVKAQLIITSRPYGIESLPAERRNIEITGFDDQNIKRYIEQFYGDRAQKLLDLLPQYPLLWSNAHIPVLLNIICGLLVQSDIAATSLKHVLAELSSIGVLYERMEVCLLERIYCLNPESPKKLKHASPERKARMMREHFVKHRNLTGALAYTALQHQQLVIPLVDFENILFTFGINDFEISEWIDAILSLGFLRSIISADNVSTNFEFCHLSFQEYYAATYIAMLLQTDQFETLQALQSLKFAPRYQLVWRFVSGLLRHDQKSWLRLIEFLQSDVHEDLIGHHRLNLLMACADEAHDMAERTGVLSQLETKLSKHLSGFLALYQKQQLPGIFASVLLDRLKESLWWLDSKPLKALRAQNKRLWQDFLGNYHSNFLLAEQRNTLQANRVLDSSGGFYQDLPVYEEPGHDGTLGRGYYQKSLEYRHKGQMPKAYNYLLRAAQERYPHAYVNLILMAKGIFPTIWTTETNAEEAEKWLNQITSAHRLWFQTQAEMGHPEAQTMLALMYEYGLVFNQDNDKTIQWYRAAAEQGYPRAQHFLGYAYDDGKVVEQNYTEYHFWTQKAASLGLAGAQSNLGFSYKSGDTIEKDIKQAAFWFKKAADQGHAKSQNQLGMLYRDEPELRDEAQAIHYFKKAAETGFLEAEENLASCYKKGIGGKEDLEKAQLLYQNLDQQQGKSDLVYLVKGIDAGRKAWYYVLIDRDKVTEFITALNDNIIHLENYGKIIHSAYGNEPPEALTNRLKENYRIGDRNEDRRALLGLGEKLTTEQKILRSLSGLADSDVKVRRAAVDTIVECGDEAARTPEVLSKLIHLIRGKDELSYRARIAFEGFGATAVTTNVLKEILLEITPNVLQLIQTLVEDHLSTLLKLKTETIWPILFIGASFSRAIHFGVVWNEQQHYVLQGLCHGAPFNFVLTLKEAQLIRHVSELFFETFQQSFTKTLALFIKEDFIAPEQDALLPEYQKMLFSSSKEKISTTQRTSTLPAFFSPPRKEKNVLQVNVEKEIAQEELSNVQVEAAIGDLRT